MKHLSNIRRVLLFGFILMASLVAQVFAGGDFYVTSVIRNFPMKSGDPVYHDFYINAGKNNGLKNGMQLDAIRKVSAFDNLNSKVIGDAKLRIAKLKVIHADEKVSVARLMEYSSKENTPLAGHESVMMGDLVEVTGK